MEPSHVQITIRPIRKPKRFRSAFTTEQIKFLELQFKKFPYISSEHRKEIATALNMQERAVKIWFQNRRMKEKKESTNKELDYVPTNKVEDFCKDRLNNACSLPSANEQLSYSLPIIVKPVDTSSTFVKANDDIIHREIRSKIKTQQVPQNFSTNRNKIPIATNQHPSTKYQVPLHNEDFSQRSSTLKKQIKNINQPIHKKTEEFSIDLSKKMRKSRTEMDLKVLYRKPKLHSKFVHLTNATKPITSLEDFSSNTKATEAQMPLRPQKKAAVNGPSYFPVMPTNYAHPYISSGGVIWKPINIMPIVAPESAISFPNSPQSFGYDQKRNCDCNCHGNAQPFTMSTNPISPYTQYVMTAPAPFQSSSPKIQNS